MSILFDLVAGQRCALTMLSLSASKSPKETPMWRCDGRLRVSILGRVGLAILNALSCFRRSNTVVCNQAGRPLTLKIGSHGLLLTTPCTYNIIEEVGG